MTKKLKPFRIHTSMELAKLAEVADPDKHDDLGFFYKPTNSSNPSAGAKFLRKIEQSTYETIEWDWHEWESSSEVAETSVPVYTHKMWEVFVDLCAYQEEPSEGLVFTSFHDAVSNVLFDIAKRLSEAIYEEWEKSDE